MRDLEASRALSDDRDDEKYPSESQPSEPEPEYEPDPEVPGQEDDERDKLEPPT